jgi:hypothetical protein
MKFSELVNILYAVFLGLLDASTFKALFSRKEVHLIFWKIQYVIKL